MKKSVNVKTKNYEIYMKLPNLNYVEEVIFSPDVSYNSISRIVKNLEKNYKGVLEIVSVGDRFAVIRRGGRLNMNVYFMGDKK